MTEERIGADRFESAMRTLAETRETVTAEVDEAEESARANPRRRRHRGEREENSRRIIDLLLELQAADDASLAEEVRDELAGAIRSTADLVATPLGDPDAPQRLREAGDALADYQRALGTPRPGTRPEIATGAAMELCLRRIIDVSRPFV